MRKGLSLPIEMIVIVAVAVLVLVVIAAFFVGGAGRLGGVGDAVAFASGCDKLRLNDCSAGVSTSSIAIDGYREPKRSSFESPEVPGTLLRACYNSGRVLAADTAERDCRVACGCPAS